MALLGSLLDPFKATLTQLSAGLANQAGEKVGGLLGLDPETATVAREPVNAATTGSPEAAASVARQAAADQPPSSLIPGVSNGILLLGVAAVAVLALRG